MHKSAQTGGSRRLGKGTHGPVPRRPVTRQAGGDPAPGGGASTSSAKSQQIPTTPKTYATRYVAVQTRTFLIATILPYFFPPLRFVLFCGGVDKVREGNIPPGHSSQRIELTGWTKEATLVSCHTSQPPDVGDCLPRSLARQRKRISQSIFQLARKDWCSGGKDSVEEDCPLCRRKPNKAQKITRTRINEPPVR